MPWQNIKEMGPHPTEPVEFALFQFAGLAGENAAHPRDWDRFYRFIVRAHARRRGWDAGDVTVRLKKYGFREDVARMLGEAYWHARCALYVRNHFDRRYGHLGWVKRDGSPLT